MWGRGRHHLTWFDNITGWTGLGLHSNHEVAGNRETPIVIQRTRALEYNRIEQGWGQRACCGLTYLWGHNRYMIYNSILILSIFKTITLIWLFFLHQLNFMAWCGPKLLKWLSAKPETKLLNNYDFFLHMDYSNLIILKVTGGVESIGNDCAMCAGYWILY